MLIQGDPLHERQFVERIRREASSFVGECNPSYGLVMRTDFGVEHLKQLRETSPKWTQIIQELREGTAPGKLKNASRESGACYTMKYYDNHETFVFAFNPFVNISISFIQDTSGFRLDTAKYREFENTLVSKCIEMFGTCNELPKEYYATRLHDFGSSSIVDLAFESETLVYKAYYQDRFKYPSIPVMTGDQVKSIPLLKQLTRFIHDYCETMREFSVSYDVEYFEENLIEFDTVWKEFEKSKHEYYFVYLDDLNGYLACSKSQKNRQQICVAIAPYLPYWMTFMRDTSASEMAYIEVKEEELIQSISSWVNYFYDGYEQISLKQADWGLKGMQGLTVGSVLFGEFLGKRISQHRSVI